MQPRLWIAALLFLLAALPLGASAAPASVAVGKPHTLVTVGDSISGFAQDGPRIAWLTAKGRLKHCVRTLRIRFLPTRRTLTTLQKGCYLDDATELALAGRAAVWQNLVGVGNLELAVDVWTAVAGARRAHRLDQLIALRDIEAGEPHAVLPLAGAGSLLVYDSEQDNRAPRERAIRRVVAGTGRMLFAFDRPVGLAVFGSRIAAVRRALVAPGAAEPVADVEIHSAAGALLAAFVWSGVPKDVALGSRHLALLMNAAAGRSAWIVVIDASNWASERLVFVDADSRLAQGGVSGRWVVFRTGRTIRALDATTGAMSTLVRTPTVPVGLSVSDRRVAWAENFSADYAHPGGRGRIRALMLPSSAG